MTIALFWGAVVTEKEPHTYPGSVLSECILSGFTISLSEKAKGSERTVLSVQPLNGEKTVLASLRLGQTETVKVDLRFRETVIFSVSGPNELHLAGFITPTQDFRVPADALAMMDAEDDESEEEAEDDGAEESDELLPTNIHGADEDDDDDEDDEEEEEEDDDDDEEEAEEAPVIKQPIAQAKKRPATDAIPTNAQGSTKKAKVESQEGVKSQSTQPKPTPTAQPAGKKRLPSGLQYEILKTGTGKPAQAGRSVTVRYSGMLAKNGRQFDSGSITFRLGAGEVIRGWDEGVAGMLAGERRKLLVPSALGYGKRGAGRDIPPHSDLVFDVQMLKC